MYLLDIVISSIFIKILQFVLSLSILVVVHEYGHFLAARLFQCRVEKFYLFFNPWFSLIKKKIGQTEYGIGWIPLGGYVKIAGMMDESRDKKSLAQPPKPDEYRSKPAYQRLIIILGGVIFNVVLAGLIYIFIAYVWGDSFISNNNLKYGIHASYIGKKMGIQDGDVIVKVGSVEIDNSKSVISEITSAFVLDEPNSIEVLRDGKRVELLFTKDVVKEVIEYITQRNDPALLFPIRFPTIVDEVSSAAKITEGQLQKGDKILTLNGQPATFFYDLTLLRANYKNQVIDLQVLRGNETVNLKAKTDTNGLIGFTPLGFGEVLGYTTIKYSFFASIGKGFTKCISTVGKYVKSIYRLFASDNIKISESVGSVVSIANIFPSTWDWESFWNLTGFISIMLAVVNLLPIPALDGGHAVFILIEMITRKKPSEKVVEYAQLIGMALMLLLFAYTLGLDFKRFFY